jgi:hypothetical protein
MECLLRILKESVVTYLCCTREVLFCKLLTEKLGVRQVFGEGRWKSWDNSAAKTRSVRMPGNAVAGI